LKAVLWIIDDDEDELFLLQKNLLRLKPALKIVGFSNSELALDAWKDAFQQGSLPHLVYSDLNMLPLNGIELFQAMEALVPASCSTRMILASGLLPSDWSTRVQSLRLLTATIHKPNQYCELAQLLISWMQV